MAIDYAGNVVINALEPLTEVHEWRKDYILGDDYIEKQCATIEQEGWTVVSVYPVGGGDERLAVLSKRTKPVEKKNPIGFFQPVLVSKRTTLTEVGYDFKKEQEQRKKELDAEKNIKDLMLFHGVDADEEYWAEIHRKREEAKKELYVAKHDETKKVVSYDIETSSFEDAWNGWRHNKVTAKTYKDGLARMHKTMGTKAEPEDQVYSFKSNMFNQLKKHAGLIEYA